MAGLDRLDDRESLQAEIAAEFGGISKIRDKEEAAELLYLGLKEKKSQRTESEEYWANYLQEKLGLDLDPDDLKQLAVAVGTAKSKILEQWDEHKEIASRMEATQDKIKDNPFYKDYGGQRYFDDLFSKQERERNKPGFGFDATVRAQEALLNNLLAGAEIIDGVTAGIPFAFFEDVAVDLFAPANDKFFGNIKDGNPDCSEAIRLAEAAGEVVKENYKNYQSAEKALSDPKRLERSVQHCLESEQNLLDLKNDPQKIVRLLRARYGIEFDPRFESEYLNDTLITPYIERVEKGYQQQLKANKQAVERSHAEVLQEADGRFFESKEAYEAFVKEEMQNQFPDDKKYMPDSEWDRIKARNVRLAEQAWEQRINKGEQAAWQLLEPGLAELKSQKFATEADFHAYLQKLGEKVESRQVLPNAAWDELIRDRFKEKANTAWEGYLEIRTEKTWGTLDKALATAESQKFHRKADLVKFIQTHTDKLNQQKLIPDEQWNRVISQNLRAKVETLWTQRDKEKQADSAKVRKAMESVSLSHKEKPTSTADFYNIAKKNLPTNIQGKLTDSEWDSHMKTYFYPRVKAQLKANESIVKSAMGSVSLPAASESKNQSAYLNAVRKNFAESRGNALGLIPNARYDVLRNRVLLDRARTTWREHEIGQARLLDKARGALSDKNLIRTVHHFAKNKKIDNPTTSQIKASSTHALAAQFGLNEDQLKALEPEIRSYAAQATALHKARRQEALKSVKRYQAPKDHAFKVAELKTSEAFYNSMVAASGDMKFAHADDWYLVKTEAMDHIEGLRQTELTKTKTEATEVTPEAEAASEKQAENQTEANSKHPAEQTNWMKQFGIAPESVSQKGVERFSRIMNLPEFNLGGIPRSDLKIAIPALVNMLGGFRDTTWRNFTFTIRQDMRGLEPRDPQSRFFQIIKSFAVGFPYKLTDFDIVPGIDNVFNNLVKRTKSPDGEKFTTIKNLYLNFFRSEDRLDLDADISEEEFEARMLELDSEDFVLTEEELLDPLELEAEEDLALEEPSEDELLEIVEEDTLEEDELLEDTEDEPILEAEEEILTEGEEAEDLESNEIEEEIDPELETEAEMSETEAEDTDEETLLPETEDTEAGETEEGVMAEMSEEDSELTPETDTETAENEDAEPDTAYQDYLKEGAVVLTEVDQILRTPNTEEKEEAETEEEAELQAEIIEQQQEELRPEEQKTPLDEAAEVLPEKLYKAFLKLSLSGLLSDAALSWLIENSTEFAVVDQEVSITLEQALTLVEISLRSEFLAKNLVFQIKLSQTVRQQVVINFSDFLLDFLSQTRAVDGLQQVVINGYRGEKLRGYFVTRFGKKSFATQCQLIKQPKTAKELS